MYVIDMMQLYLGYVIIEVVRLVRVMAKIVSVTRITRPLRYGGDEADDGDE